MSNGLLLWADDEMELLRAHILFLEKKGYDVVTVTNGTDAIDQCRQKTFDLILLDEMMPGLSGLETLQQIKELSPATPVVMVTKSEEENIMDQAIGSKIADYLIKPVNPNQILLSLKKNIHRRAIVTEVTQSGYRQSFQDIAMQIDACKTIGDWMEVYHRLVHWELELSSTDSSMAEMLKMQKEEADNGFAKYIKAHYMDWMDDIAASRSAASGPSARLRMGGAGRQTKLQEADERPIALFFAPTTFYNAAGNIWGQLLIKYHRLTPEAMQKTNDLLARLLPTKDVHVYSYKSDMQAMYEDTRNFRDAVLVGGFVTLAIVVIGLMGYTTDEVNRRRKEIAIRRIHGALMTDVQRLFLRDVVRMALPASLLGIAIAWKVAEAWQLQFSEKVPLSWYIFIGGMLLVHAVILAVSSYNVHRIAYENPSNSLKTE